MKKFLSLTTTVVLVSAIAVSVKASPQSDAAIHRRLLWTEQHIDQLNERRDYLHRFIRHLRQQLQPAPVGTGSSDTTTSSSSYPSGNAGCLSASQVASYARGAGFPESAISTMVYYASRESGYCPGAVNSSSGACGLWQIYPCPGSDALDPARNAALAYSKYQSAGFAPWGG